MKPKTPRFGLAALSAIVTALLCATLLGAPPLHADTQAVWYDKTRIAEIEVGLICHVEVTGTEPAPETVLGEINRIANDPVINWHGTRVPAIRGMTFGIKSRAAHGLDILNVEILTHHPPFGPNNATVERWQTDILAGDLTTRAYTFDFPYEMVTGTWVFEALSNDSLLYRVEFEVVSPEQAPLESNICDGNALMS